MIPDDKIPLQPPYPFRSNVDWEIGVPTDSEPHMAFSVDRRGPYTLPFPVRYLEGSWVNATTGDKLACDVRGWR